jgi:D-3-phosphoglycerate dehydrogenase
MTKILATDGIEAGAAKTLTDLGFEVAQQFYEADELPARAAACDVLIVRSATKVRKPTIDAAADAGRLKLIIRGGIGVDHIDVEYARAQGIEVRNTPNASAASVAELTIAHIFSLARYLYDANVSMREGRWEKKRYAGVEVSGKTLGIIGMGRIGRHTAKIAAALGMNVIYTNRTGHKPENEPFNYVPLHTLLAESDIISLHMPKADEPILTAEAIGKLKDGVFLVNTARATLIDEQAMLDGIESGKIAAVALDVYMEEPVKNPDIYTHPKISMTPHIGASTKEAQKRIGADIVAIITEKFAQC